MFIKIVINRSNWMKSKKKYVIKLMWRESKVLIVLQGQ